MSWRAAFVAAVVLLSTDRPVPPSARAPVLVELYTSEGCSSCPTADAFLEALQRDQPVDGAEVIPLGLHIDYFNNLGWKDTFSDAAYTARQEEYGRKFGLDGVFTPQMVVDGTEGLTGNDRAGVTKSIAAAARRPHLPLGLTVQGAADAARLTIELPAEASAREKIQVVAAIAQDDLTTAVPRGENKGRSLHHVAVVRSLKPVGLLTSNPSPLEARLPLSASWGAAHLNAVVWLQGVKTRQVYGVAIAPIR